MRRRRRPRRRRRRRRAVVVAVRRRRRQRAQYHSQDCQNHAPERHLSLSCDSSLRAECAREPDSTRAVPRACCGAADGATHRRALLLGAVVPALARARRCLLREGGSGRVAARNGLPVLWASPSGKQLSAARISANVKSGRSNGGAARSGLSLPSAAAAAAAARARRVCAPGCAVILAPRRRTCCGRRPAGARCRRGRSSRSGPS